jgi:hypothetical protein
MNPIDEQLNRLFRAAAKGETEPVFQPAFGLEARAMAAWRAAGAGKTSFWDMAILVRALILAGVVLVASCWPSLEGAGSPFADFLQLTDSTIPADDAP